VCGTVVCETIIRPDECEALNHTFGDSDSQTPPTVDVVLNTHTFGDSEPAPLFDYQSDRRRVVAINGTRLTYGDLDPAALLPKPPRCECGCYEFALHPTRWRSAKR